MAAKGKNIKMNSGISSGGSRTNIPVSNPNSNINKSYRNIKMSNSGGWSIDPFDENKTVNVFSLTEEDCNSTEDWVRWGRDNLTPQYLIELRKESPFHNTIIWKKRNLIAGSGFVKTGLSDEALKFLKNVKGNMSMDKIAYNVAFDYETTGDFAISPVWSNGLLLSHIDFVDVAKVRIQNPNVLVENEDGKYYNDQENYFVSRDWSRQRKNNAYCAKWVQGFSPIYHRINPVQIYMAKTHNQNMGFYGVAPYESALPWIELEPKIANYHNSNITNQFHPSLIVNLSQQGFPDDETINQYIADQREILGGIKNAGNVIFALCDGLDGQPSVQPIELNGSDKRYLELISSVEKSIIKGHQVTSPIIVGDGGVSKLGGNRNEMIEATEIFQKEYVSPRQKEIEEVFQMMAMYAGVPDWENIKLAEYKYSSKDIAVSDIFTILNSNATYEQKLSILKYKGINDEDALGILGPNLSI